MTKNSLFKSQYIYFVAISIMLFSFFFSACAFAWSDEETENILILNSYHQGFTWTRNETEGIIEGLNNSGRILSVSVEYMDWKNYPTEENLRHLTDFFGWKYRNKHLDALIVTDDAALAFALKNRKEIFSNVPIIFCGVNQSDVSDFRKAYRNFTGIIEEIDPTETINMALQLNPSVKNVYLLFDNSESGSSTDKLVMDILEYYRLTPEFLELEITETVLMESYDALSVKLDSLRKRGVRSLWSSMAIRNGLK